VPARPAMAAVPWRGRRAARMAQHRSLALPVWRTRPGSDVAVHLVRLVTIGLHLAGCRALAAGGAMAPRQPRAAALATATSLATGVALPGRAGLTFASLRVASLSFPLPFAAWLLVVL